jgi:hypothetical protein
MITPFGLKPVEMTGLPPLVEGAPVQAHWIDGLIPGKPRPGRFAIAAESKNGFYSGDLMVRNNGVWECAGEANTTEEERDEFWLAFRDALKPASSPFIGKPLQLGSDFANRPLVEGDYQPVYWDMKVNGE